MKELVLLIGLPGSGKTTYCKEQLPDHVRVSQDDQGRYGHKNFFTELLKAGATRIVVDRVNSERGQRMFYVDKARAAGYQIRYIQFIVGVDQCVDRVLNRKDHPTLKTVDRGEIKKIIDTFEWSYHLEFNKISSDECDKCDYVYPTTEDPG